jgi:hypothetical protein
LQSLDILLKDLKQNKLVKLDNNSVYRFNYNTQDNPHRFDLYVIYDHNPKISEQINDQLAFEDSLFRLDLRKFFSDPDFFDTLKFIVQTQADWLKLKDGVLYGTPTQQNIGTYKVTVIAADILNKTVSQDFTLTVLNTNDAPQLVKPVYYAEATVGEEFNLTLPTKMFVDPDPDDELTITINAPNWIKFDSNNLKLYGVPMPDNIGKTTVTITATDKAGASASDKLIINVKPNPLFAHKSFVVYPNPSAEYIYIWNERMLDNAKVEIYDMNGILYKKLTINGNNVRITVKDLQPGVYLIKLITQDMVYTAKFEKN